jgi:hypothetical protein
MEQEISLKATSDQYDAHRIEKAECQGKQRAMSLHCKSMFVFYRVAMVFGVSSFCRRS